MGLHNEFAVALSELLICIASAIRHFIEQNREEITYIDTAVGVSDTRRARVGYFKIIW